MFRDRRTGIRRIFQVAEFESLQTGARANILYRWIPEEDRLIKHSESSRFFEDINRMTGLTQKEIEQNLEDKKKILSWMIKNNIRSLTDLGKIMNYYYSNKADLLKDISQNNLKKILEK
jgi:hypothetical protein